MHERLGHPGETQFRATLLATDGHGITQDMLRLIPRMPFCIHCELAKKRKSRGRSISQLQNIFPVDNIAMCSDLSGKKTRSIRGFYHYACFVFYRVDAKGATNAKYLTVSLLKLKNDLADKLGEQMRRAEKITGKKVLIFVSDRGGEFMDSKVVRFLLSQGIECVPASAEKQNQNPTERFIGLTSECGVPKLTSAHCRISYWCLAVEDAGRDIAYRPSGKLKMSMHESWYGVRPNVKHAFRFGAIAVCYRTEAQMHSGGFNQKGFLAKVVGLDSDKRPNAYIVADRHHKLWHTSDIKILTGVRRFKDVAPDILVSGGTGDDNDTKENAVSFVDDIDTRLQSRTASEQGERVQVQGEHKRTVPEQGEPAPEQNIDMPVLEDLVSDLELSDSDIGSDSDASSDSDPEDAHQFDLRPRGGEGKHQETLARNEAYKDAKTDKGFHMRLRSNRQPRTRDGELNPLQSTEEKHTQEGTHKVSSVHHAFYTGGIKKMSQVHRACWRTMARIDCLGATEVVDARLEDLWNHRDPIWRDRWRAAIKKELTCLHVDKAVWKPIPRSDMPPGKRLMKGRFVFAIKRDQHNKFIKAKARYVAKGYAQEYFGRTYSPTLSRVSTRVLVAVSARLNLQIFTKDVVNAHLCAPLEPHEFEYIECPKVFAETLQDKSLAVPGIVLMTMFALYGMVNAALAWNKEYKRAIEAFQYKGHKFTTTKTDPSVHVLRAGGHILIIGNHVDDGIMATNNIEMLTQFVHGLPWPVQEFGKIEHFLSVSCLQDLKNGTISLHQKGQVESYLKKFQIGKGRSIPISRPVYTNDDKASKIEVNEFLSMNGAMLHFQGNTYPELSYAVSLLGSFASNPSETHRTVIEEETSGHLRHALESHCIKFSRQCCHKDSEGKDPALNEDGTISTNCDISHFRLEAFVDSNFIDVKRKVGQDIKKLDSRSRGGTIIKMVGGPIDWHSKKHTLKLTPRGPEEPYTDLHTQEAEHIEASKGIQKCRGIRNFLFELGFKGAHVAVPVFEDNMQCARLATEQINRTKSKHIPLYFHHIQEWIKRGQYAMYKMPDQHQLADIFTKALDRPKFEYISAAVRGVSDYDPMDHSTLIV